MKIQFQQKMHGMNLHVPTQKRQDIPLKHDGQPKDTIFIGTQVRQLFNQHQQKNSLIESLMKQRENIQEMKSNLTERALDNGDDPSNLKEQMKALEKQMADIDAQIAQAQKEKQESTSTNTKNKEPQTIEEAIFSYAVPLEQTKTLSRMDRSLTREKASLESEMKLDAKRGVHSEYKADRLAKIDDQMVFVQESLITQVSQTTEITNENKTAAKALTEEELTVQEQMLKNADTDEDKELASNEESSLM